MNNNRDLIQILIEQIRTLCLTTNELERGLQRDIQEDRDIHQE